VRPLLALALLAALAPSPARAHVRLVEPTSRYGDEMKFGPCGRLGGARSANVTTYPPGAAITVVFDEIVPHPGHYRIAFDPSGDDDLAPPLYDGARWVTPAAVQVLADDLFDPPPPALYHGEVQVTLPDVECSDCTLQLVQVMTDKPPYDGGDDFYYQCADLRLVKGAPLPTPPPPPAAPPADPPRGGCGAPGGALSALLPLALLLRPRRRSRSPRRGTFNGAATRAPPRRGR